MKYRLHDLIDVAQFQALQDRLNEIYPFPSSIIDNEGNILTATAWQDICTKFHRKNKESEKECIKSDQYIVSHLAEANPAVSYLCPHGLIDNAAPIIIDGEHLGNFFTGQFFLEKPDLEFFKKQAERYGFDQEAYLDAVRKVPVWTKEQLNSYLSFIRRLIEVIGSIGLKNLKAIESEKKVGESEERLRLAMMGANDGLWDWNLQTDVVYYSPRWKSMLGYAPDELDHTIETWKRLVHPDDKERTLAVVRDLVEGRIERYEVEFRMKHKDGSFRHILSRAFLTHVADGAVSRLVGTHVDITERKNIEQLLRKSEEKYRAIVENTTEWIWSCNKHGIHTYSNNAVRGILGYTPEEFTGRSALDMVHPDDVGEISRCVKEAVSSRSGWSKRLFRWQHKDGSYRTLESTATPILDADGSLRGWHGVDRDITERHLLEEERLKTQKLESIGTLAGGIAHDFNNLLQGIFGYISMAKMTDDNKEKMLDMLAHAENALHQSVNLTAQLLTFSKGGTPVKKVFHLRPVIENSVKFALSGSRIEYALSVDGDLHAVEADEGQIAQVIQNIVLNGEQAMPMGGKIEVSARNMPASVAGIPSLFPRGDCVEITVRDHGIGIPAAHLTKIFDPYFTTKEKGSGLGLATAYSIIRNHGGTIAVSSDLGKGSTFTVRLPASARKPEPSSSGEDPEGEMSGRILVMDDEEVVREVAGELITALGHHVALTGHGEETLTAYLKARDSGMPFDAVILDLTIRGGMGGIETLKRLKEVDPEVKAIVSSGYSEDAALSEYEQRGFVGVLKKPYTIDGLRKSLNRVLN